MTTLPQPHYPDRRSTQFRIAQRAREAEESKHDRLCIRFTADYGMTSCWCLCKLCWDRIHDCCICSACHCRATNILPPITSPNTIPKVQRRE